ncbi:MAG: response regulator [Bacteroidales bacterium]|nr:response regulator [Bacteroidales bacterium]
MISRPIRSIAILFITILTLQSTILTSAKNQTLEQKIHFTHFSVNEGLSHGTVVSCCQDSLGHIWFATNDGLNRYDGYEFHVYRNIENEENSIATNIIKTVYCGTDGTLWVGTETGLSKYDRNTDRFININTSGKAITGITELEHEKKLLAAVGGGLWIFDTERMSWDDQTTPHQKDSFGATILYSEGENIWIGTQQDGLFLYNQQTKELRKVAEYPGHLPIHCISRHDGAIWVATEGDGLFRLDPETGRVRIYVHTEGAKNSISSNYVRTISSDIDGRLWIGTFNGLDIIEEENISNFRSDPFTIGSLSQPSVRCIMKDNQGGMWLGTWFGGINYWHPQKNRFRNIQRSIHGDSLNDNIVSCIAEDSDNTLWIGTKSGGLNHYYPETGAFEYYSLKKNPHNERIESNDIKAIHIDEEGRRIYFGAHAGGVNILDKESGDITNCNYGRLGCPPLDVYSIIAAEDGYLWVGTLSGLKKFNKRSMTFEDIDKDCNGKPLRNLRIKYLLKDSGNRLWIGGEKGLECLEITNKGLLPFHSEILEATRTSAFVNCIYESSSKLIWIATSNGMLCYDERENQLIKYNISNGLPSNMIHGIEEDSFGRIWMSTDNGLCCFNPFSGGFRNFSIYDGIQSNQFNTYSHCRQSNGNMLFGGICGITVFRPENMRDNTFCPQPQISRLSISNKEIRPNDGSGILDRNIQVTERISLRHEQNNISVTLTVPNFLAGHNNTFAYILEGYDKEWTETTQRTILYSNLPHGKYKLKIKAANNDGKWNDEPVTLDIHIKPMWYKTLLAKIIFALLFITAIALAYWMIVRKKEDENRIELEKQENTHQEEIHQMKTRFFINISHEMRTPLTLIINPLQEMIAKSSDTWMRKQLRYVERNAKRLMHLVNQLMDYRRAELGVFKLKIRPEDVHKIIKENFSYYENLAKSKNIRYSLLSDLEDKTLSLDGNYIELILNNLLSNAFKYTDNGSITVRATQHANEFILEVCDTGNGIPAGQQDMIFERFYQIDNEHIGSGIGLSLVQRLVELHHGRIILDSTEGKGSIFTIILPLNPDAYSADEIENMSRDIHTSNSLEYYMLDTERQTEDETVATEGKISGRILIAEDNEEIRTYMNNGLSPMYDTILAKNGEEALKIANENELDLIITDMMMPIMDGIKLCSSLKQDLSTSHIPVIMLSAKAEKEDELNALKSGADDFVAKPFSMSILKAKIGNILRTQHRLQNKVSKSIEITPEKISFNTMDETFLQNAISIVEKNMDNSDFSTKEFASEMNMSRSNLHLKLKALTGESALDLIRRIRFKEACRLLKEGRYTIAEISYMVGFNTPSYFATCFKKYIGCLPTEYVKNLK